MNWQTLSNSSLHEVIAWAETQPWCERMQQCVQDAEWHAEGDVWTHTKLVCQELTRLKEWLSLSPAEQTVLLCVALFHDAAKPLTTEIDEATGRVTSPNHAVKGEQLARNVLRDLECDLHTRELIAKLVRFHGRPAFLLERKEPSHEVVKLSWLLNNRLLYLFALADTRGRDTTSMTRPEENLHLWKMVAEEYGCFTDRFSFANDAARLMLFQSDEPNLHYVPHEDYACEVTMMSGLPGSGKDTWLKQNTPELATVSLDKLRREMGIDPTNDQGAVIQHATEVCREYLRAKKSFAFNATNLLASTRRRWLGLFRDYNARVRIVYVEPPLRTILQQNRDRKHIVPESVITRLAKKCEPPSWNEAHEIEYDSLESRL